MPTFVRAVAGTLLSLVITSAHADIMFSSSPTGTGENVVFNQQPDNQSGNTILGNITPTNTLVQFFSSQVITSPSAGQARIESFPNGSNNLNNLTTVVPGFFFDVAVFNLNATADGSVIFTGINNAGATTISSLFDLDAGGQNFFTITAFNGQHISSVSFSSSIALDDVRQIRFGTLTAVPGPIVGTGVSGLLAACVGLLVLARRRRRLAI
jgi:hypothetical protein